MPPVAAQYHLKTGLVTDVAVADSVTASPLHISVLLLVTVIASAELPTVIVTTLLGSEMLSSEATRRKWVVVESDPGE